MLPSMRKPQQNMGAAIRALREERHLSLRRFTTLVCMRMPEPLWISDETIRRLESGQITEERADPFLMLMIADVLGIKLSQLSRVAAQNMDQLREQVIRYSSWSPGTAGVAA